MARCCLSSSPRSLIWSGVQKSHESHGFTKSASARIVASDTRKRSKVFFFSSCYLCEKKSLNDQILRFSSFKSKRNAEICVEGSVQDGRQLLGSIKARWPSTEKEEAWSEVQKFHDSHGFDKSASARIVASDTRKRGKVSFFRACYLCEKKSLNDQILRFSSLKSNDLFHQGNAKICVEESVQDGRQLLGSIKARWPSTEEEEICSRVPKWRKLLRKLRAEVRKVSCITRSPGFSYDPLSYAMNFDEGCWKSDIHGEGYLHSMRFSAPMVLESDIRVGETTENMPLRTYLSLSHSSSLSLWQRRKASKAPALDPEELPSWRCTPPKYDQITLSPFN